MKLVKFTLSQMTDCKNFLKFGRFGLNKLRKRFKWQWEHFSSLAGIYNFDPSTVT